MGTQTRRSNARAEAKPNRRGRVTGEARARMIENCIVTVITVASILVIVHALTSGDDSSTTTRATPPLALQSSR